MQPRTALTILATVLALGALGGCKGAAPREDIPLRLEAADAVPPSATPLGAEAIAARAERSVLHVEVPPRGVKTPGDYGRDVGLSFLTMLTNPFHAPIFVLEVLFGWLDFQTTYGTAFVVTARGHAVTNAHVVGDAHVVHVWRADGAKGKARVVARDDARDLALLRLELPGDALLSPEEVAPVTSRALLHLGQPVVLYGYPTRPFPQEEPHPTVTHGIVSSLDLDAGEAARRVQLDAPANAGNSGGPVFDDRGRVVGVVTEAADPGSFAGQSFAIPIDDVAKAFFTPE